MKKEWLELGRGRGRPLHQAAMRRAGQWQYVHKLWCRLKLAGEASLAPLMGKSWVQLASAQRGAVPSPALCFALSWGQGLAAPL